MKSLAAFCLVLAGCGTLEDLTTRPGPRVFGGLRTDWRYMSGTDRNWPIIGVFWVFDVPLSLPLDVVLLPLTIPLSLSERDE